MFSSWSEGIVVSRRGHTGILDQNLVAVAPFDVVDADLKLWHEGMVDVLSRNLDGAGPLRTVSPTLVVRRWAGRADKESAISLGKATGARLAVFGSLIRSGLKGEVELNQQAYLYLFCADGLQANQEIHECWKSKA